MSTATNLTNGIRVDQATQKGSVNKVIALVTGKKGSYAIQLFLRIKECNNELIPRCDKLRINGKGRGTPVADAATLVEIAWLCPGRGATEVRREGAESVCRMLGGDLSLVDEIQRRHAQVAGTAEGQFLLAGNSSSDTQVALPELPYTMEQLQQMQAAARAIVASKEGIQQCAVVLHDFPIEKYSQYVELKGKEMLLKEKDFGLCEQRFGLKQKQDEHGLRMDREKAKLEDRSAKKRRFDASTDGGVTFRTLLAQAAEGAKGFQDKARQMSLGLGQRNARLILLHRLKGRSCWYRQNSQE